MALQGPVARVAGKPGFETYQAVRWISGQNYLDISSVLVPLLGLYEAITCRIQQTCSPVCDVSE